MSCRRVPNPEQNPKNIFNPARFSALHYPGIALISTVEGYCSTMISQRITVRPVAVDLRNLADTLDYWSGDIQPADIAPILQHQADRLKRESAANG